MADNFYEPLDKFLSEDAMGQVAKKYMQFGKEDNLDTTCPDSYGYVLSQFSGWYAEGLDSKADYAEFIEKSREIVDKSDLNKAKFDRPGKGADEPANVFASGSLYGLNEQYVNLAGRTASTIGFACLPVFFVIALFLFDAVAALVCIFFVALLRSSLRHDGGL